MSFHFCSHAWEVQDLEDGVIVRLRNRDLDEQTVPVLVDDLFVLVQESGKTKLYLDFADIGLVSSNVLGKLAELNTNLREQNLQLIFLNLNSALVRMVESLQLADVFDIRSTETAGAIV